MDLIRRLIYVKIVFGILAVVSVVGVGVYGAVKVAVDDPHNPRAGELGAKYAREMLPKYSPFIVIGCLAMAGLVGFGDLAFGGGRSGSTPVLSDEEFLARMELDARQNDKKKW